MWSLSARLLTLRFESAADVYAFDGDTRAWDERSSLLEARKAVGGMSKFSAHTPPVRKERPRYHLTCCVPFFGTPRSGSQKAAQGDGGGVCVAIMTAGISVVLLSTDRQRYMLSRNVIKIH